MALDDYGSALVTGASSGIGAAVVRSLRARGLSVHAMARRQQRLDALAEETGCVSHVLDAPWWVNVSFIELQPTEQVFGGVRIAPADQARSDGFQLRHPDEQKPAERYSGTSSVPSAISR